VIHPDQKIKDTGISFIYGINRAGKNYPGNKYYSEYIDIIGIKIKIIQAGLESL